MAPACFGGRCLVACSAGREFLPVAEVEATASTLGRSDQGRSGPIGALDCSGTLPAVAGWILESSSDPSLRLRLPRGSVKTLGRTARADLIVDAALVSRLHCRLTANVSDQLVVEDLGSTNGILVNGARVDRGVLKSGDTLTVGRVEFRVRN